MGLVDSFRSAFIEGIRRANPNAKEVDLRRISEELETRMKEEPPPRIALIGEAGVGKTSTLNALFNAGLPISHTRACTKNDIELAIDLGSSSGFPRYLIAYDMPGLGESISEDKKNLAVYERVLPEVDVFVWVLDAQNRAIRLVQQLISDELAPRLGPAMSRLVIALNKADLVDPGQLAWNPRYNVPGADQETNIHGRASDVSQKIREVLPSWSGRPIPYSAVKRYRLTDLFRQMLEAVPEQRRWLLGDRMSLASYEELVDKQVLQALRTSR